MFRLSIQTQISAAHFLKQYEGDCARLHGHNWKVQVEVLSDQLDNVGMAIDFKDLTELSKRVIGRFDHQVFNEIAPFDKINPTAEHLARYFYREIARELPAHVKMASIKLWETDKYLVEYSE